MTTKISAAEYADVCELFKAGRVWERSHEDDAALRRSGRIKPRRNTKPLQPLWNMKCNCAVVVLAAVL